MKKTFIFSLVIILTMQSLHGQSCWDIFNKAKISYQSGNLRLALQQLQDAETCDFKNELEKERQYLQRQIFNTVEEAKLKAEKKRFFN